MQRKVFFELKKVLIKFKIKVLLNFKKNNDFSTFFRSLKIKIEFKKKSIK